MLVFVGCALVIYLSVNAVARRAWRRRPPLADVFVLDEYRAAKARSVSRDARRGAELA
jgi:hypothetical protein